MTERGAAEQRREHVIGLDPFTVPAVTHPIATAPARARVVVAGTVGSAGTVAWAGGPVTEVTLADETDLLTLVFFGDRGVAGVRTGTRLVAAGTVVIHHGRRVLMNPQLWLVPAPALPAEPTPLSGSHDRHGARTLVPALAAGL